MKIYLKPRNSKLDFERVCFDVEINSTVDQLISHLNLKYNQIDATALEVFFKGRKLPFDMEIIKLNLMDEDELEVGVKESSCCLLL